MPVACPVNVEWDITIPFFCIHNYIVPPMPVPVPTVSVEVTTTQFWHPGYWVNQNKWTITVKHKGISIAQEGHNIGILIPDITIPVVNAWYIVMWPFSKRKMMFSASTVRLDGSATGCSAIWPPFPMMACGEPISLPVTFPLNIWNSVSVGLSLWDILKGSLKIVASIAIDYIFERIGYKGGGKRFDRIMKNTFNRVGRLPKYAGGVLFSKEVLGEIAKSFLGKVYVKDEAIDIVKEITKDLVSSLTEFGIDQINGKDNKLTIGVGNPYIGAEVSFGSSHEEKQREGLGAGIDFFGLDIGIGDHENYLWGEKLD